MCYIFTIQIEVKMNAYQVHKDYVVLFFLCLCSGIYTQTVTLTPTEADVIEHESITLTCSYIGTIQVSNSSRWSYSAISTNPVIVLIEGSCLAAGFLNNTALYSWTCLENNSFSLTIKKVERTNHGETWSCRQDNIESNTVEIFVKVPVQSVAMTMPNTNKTTVSENSSATFICSSSLARPGPNIEWFLAKTPASDGKMIINNVTQSNSTNEDNLTTTTGTLQYKPTRTSNNSFIYCIAHNVKNQRVQSNKILLNVTYAPDGPPTTSGFKNNTKYLVIEGEEGNLKCISKGGNPQAVLAWKCFNFTQITYTNETTVTAEVTWKASRKYTGSCLCSLTHIETPTMVTSVSVEVLYPPSKPIIMKDSLSLPAPVTINVIINNTLVMSCNSSGNPYPSFSWTLPDGRKSHGPLLNITHFDFDNKGEYVCTATNEMHASDGKKASGLNNSHLLLAILYPPNDPTFQFRTVTGPNIENMSLKVVSGDTFKIACTSNGQPEPTYSWSYNDKINKSQVLTVSSILNDLVATCVVSNVMNETVGELREGMAQANVTINVLYPPMSPTISLQADMSNVVNVSNEITVIERQSFTLECQTISKPVSSYSWYGPFTSTSSVLPLRDITREQSGTYSCHSFNEMQRTFGTKEKGENSTSIAVHVLYAPEIGNLQPAKAIESSLLNITCPIVKGYPNAYTVFWTRKSDGQFWDGHNLLILEISRNDAGMYTCTVNNTMMPTAGEVVYGRNNRSIELEVYYEASVSDFYVKKHYGINPVVIEENTTVELRCNLASNPKPNVTIFHMSNILKRQEGTLSMSHMLKTLRCEQSGVYKCTGINAYNDLTPAEKYLTLYVRCFPRPSPHVILQTKFFLDEHDRVTISFTVIAYPIPAANDYKWRKYVGSVWIPLENNGNIIIDTSGLQTNLTIVDVGQTDFGTYRLEIQNPVGIYEQRFSVGPKVKPEPPSNFEHLENSASEESLTVQWKPGLDGGYPQTFILRYRKASEKIWNEISIQHESENTINYTLTGLASGTEYDVEIYSFNKLGQSAPTVTLRIKTQDIQRDAMTSNPSYIGIAAGSAAGLIVIIAGVVVIIVVRRRRSGNSQQSQELVRYENEDALKQKRPMSDGKNEDYEEIGPPVVQREPYERLKTNRETLHAYQDIDESEVSHGDKRPKEIHVEIGKVGKAGQIVRYVTKEAEHEEKKILAPPPRQKGKTTSNDGALTDYENLP